MRLRPFALLILAVVFVSTLQAQEEKQSKGEKLAQKQSKKNERDEIEKVLAAYTVCPATPTELMVYAAKRVAKDQNQTLARDTPDGVKGISRTDSYDVLITFKDKMRFADIRPDRSKPEEYENDKKVALANLQYTINTGKAMAVREPVEKSYNGFIVYSDYRSELIGNTLGISLIFDDLNKVITTVYFANAPKDNLKNFKDVVEWTAIRERFLESYSGCVRARF